MNKFRTIKVYVIVALLLVVSFTALGTLLESTMATSIIFNDGFESGNFSAWTGTSESPTISSTYVHSGNYSCKISSETYVYKSLTPASAMDIQVYVYFTVLPSYRYYMLGICGFEYAGFHGYPFWAGIYCDPTTGKTNWTLQNMYSNDINESNSQPSLNTWYCVELQFARGGTGVLYLNGNPLCTLSCAGVSTDESFAGSDASHHGTEYIDDCTIGTGYIGSVPVGPITFSSISANAIFPGQPCLFSCLVSANNVSYYIFSTNNTASWVNDTATAFVAGQASAWANVTKTLISTVGVTVAYEWYANDTSNSWAASGIRTLTTSTFTIMAPLPSGSSDLPGVSYNGLVYVFGGYGTDSSNYLSSVYCYNPANNSWVPESSMTYARWGEAATVYDGIAYVFGGVDGASNDRVEAYNFTSDSWATKNDLPTNLARGSGPMAVTVGSYIYVLCEQYVYQYNPATDTYTRETSNTASRRWGTCAYVNVSGDARIYVIGGYDDNTGTGVSTVYYYSVTNNNWTLVSGSAPYSAYGTTRDNPVINGLIFYGYGNNATSTGFYSCMYSYNPVTNAWTSLGSGNYPRDGVACAAVNGRLYVIGGRNVESGPHGLTYNEAYNTQITDTTSPTLGSITANTTVAGAGVNLSCTVSDNVAVSSYTYSWNNTGSWANQTVVSASGSSVTATLTGTWNSTSGNTVSVKVYANDTSNNWNASSQYNFVITSASASKLVFTVGAGQSLTAGGLSSSITVQRQDQYGNPVTFGSLTVSLGSTSGGAAFYSDAGTTQASSVTINAGSSSVSFWYEDTVADSPTLTVSSTGLASATTTFTVTPTSASKLVFTSGTNQSLVAGQLSGQITAQRQDQYGNIATSGNVTVNLSSTSAGAAFYSNSAATTPVSSVVIFDGSSTVSFWYNDTVAGSPTSTVSSTGLLSAATTFVISPASLDHFTITAVSTPQTAGEAFSVAITAVDQYGNTVTSYAGQNILSDLSGTISPTTTSFFSAGAWTGSLNITKVYGNDVITTFGSGKSGTTNPFNVKPAALDHFTMSSYPSSVTTGQGFNITVTAWDAFGNIVADYTGQVYFNSSDSQAVLPYTSESKYTFTSADNGSHTFTGFALNTVPSQTITVTDSVKSATSNPIAVMLPITPPTYSNISASATDSGQPCTFSSEWNDNYGLSGYIFSTNNTGSWQNTTWIAFSSTPSWANVTQSLNSNVGAVIAYNWYANNTNGLWASTGLQTLTTTSGTLVSTPFSIVSNSTVSELAFNSTSQVLEFTVSGPSGTIGFTNVTIAKTLISDINTLIVYLDENQINYTVNDLTNSWLIYFTYHHSTHRVVMEFAPQQTKTSATRPNEVFLAIIGSAIIISVTLAITIQRKRKSRNSTKQKN